MPPPLTHARSWRSLGDHARETVRLALPVMLARISVLAIMAVDTAMTGHHDGTELAYYGLAIGPMVPMLLVGLGMLMGTLVLTAQAAGAGETRHCGHIWRVSLAHAAVLGFVLLVLCQAGEPLLLAIGQEPGLAAGAGRVLAALGWGVPGAMLFAASTFFLEAINRPRAGMFVMLGANVLNVALNWVFIYGNLGVPEMGAYGAAAATSIVRWATFAAVTVYILAALDRERYGIGRAGGVAPAGLGARLRRIGYPLSCAYGLESGAFATLTVFAGWMGALEVAGFQIALNLVGLVFMGALGFGVAGSVRVGNAVGRRDPGGVRDAGWVAISMALALGIAFGSAFQLWPDAFASLYSVDRAVIAVAVPAITVGAVAVVADSAQGAIMTTLRGTGDVWPATVLYLLSFWAVMVPVAYVLGVARGGGAAGLVMGMAAGCGCAAVLVGWRFQVVSGHAVERV